MIAVQRLAFAEAGRAETTSLCRNQLQATQTAQKRGASHHHDMTLVLFQGSGWLRPGVLCRGARRVGRRRVELRGCESATGARSD